MGPDVRLVILILVLLVSFGCNDDGLEKRLDAAGVVTMENRLRLASLQRQLDTLNLVAAAAELMAGIEWWKEMHDAKQRPRRGRRKARRH
jgi:hypothetical protein